MEEFVKQLPELWKLGEVRPTHRKKAHKPHTWCTRKDPFELVFPMILKWLESEPDRTAKELFLRLQKKHPGEFRDCQLRTLQRRIKDWRSKSARDLLKLCTYKEMSSEEVTTTTAR